MWAATRRAPSSSPDATEGDTAVTASARSPSARWASAATTLESTPPENATTARPSSAIRASSSAVIVRRRQRSRPDRLDRLAADLRRARAVRVLGREVHDAAVEPADLHAHGLARDLDGPGL